MNTIDHCLIIDNNSSRISLLEQSIRESKVASKIKLTLNCGHGLQFLKELWLKAGEQKTLVIMNVNTPIMDGYEFLEELKDTPYSQSQKILLVAMNDTMNEKEIETYKEKGINNFISLPFSLDTLSSLIKEKFLTKEITKKKASGKTLKLNQN